MSSRQDQEVQLLLAAEALVVAGAWQEGAEEHAAPLETRAGEADTREVDSDLYCGASQQPAHSCSHQAHDMHATHRKSRSGVKCASGVKGTPTCKLASKPISDKQVLGGAAVNCAGTAPVCSGLGAVLQ